MRRPGAEKGMGAMSTVDFENHFATQSWVDALRANLGFPRITDDPRTGMPRLWHSHQMWQPLGLIDKLMDLGEGRIHMMDAAGIDVAVLSLTAPGPEQLDPPLGSKVARESNDRLAEAVQKYRGRFAGFATLASRDTDVAVAELERCVKDLGFRGWYTTSNLGDCYLDEKHIWPLLAKAEELEIPVYIHPTVPMIQQMTSYGFCMAGPTFGFGTETAMVMIRLIVSGAFDAFPKLQVIMGHLGEGLPFMLDRVDRPYVQGHVQPDPDVAPVLKHNPSYYLTNNLIVSNSGNYLPAAFTCTKKGLGMDRIVVGSDYPYEDPSQCMAFLADQRLTITERESLLSGNAVRLGVI